MPTEYWFPTPIYYARAEESEIAAIDQELYWVVKNAKQAGMNSPWDDTVETSFEYDKSLNVLAGAPTLTRLIQNHVGIYLSEVDPGVYYEASIQESWVNCYKKNSYQNAHIHHPSSISGVYIYKTNGEDGATVFMAPQNVATQAFAKREKVSYRPDYGKLMLFPSNALHYVTMNKTDHERISVSFNIDLKPKK